MGLPEVSFMASRVMISLAPTCFNQSCASDFPVKAVTSKPNFFKIATAIVPTAPVEPVTKTLPFSGVNPLFIRALIHIPAVNPAVP